MSTAPPDLSDAFFVRWVAMCRRLDVDPIDLAMVAYSESGLRANAHNPHGHASGLIQFMPHTLAGLGWTAGHEAFRALDAADQVPFVEAYYRPHAHRMGLGGQWVPQLTTAAHIYVVNYLPARLERLIGAGEGWPDAIVVEDAPTDPLAWAYRDNRGLDHDGDGKITGSDLIAHLEAVCRGARWDAIVHRLELAQGLPSVPPPPPPDTLPELPVLEDDGGEARRDATSEASAAAAADEIVRRNGGG